MVIEIHHSMMFRLLCALGIWLALSAPSFLTAQSSSYPTPSEARAAYDWIHKKVVRWVESRPGWAIFEFEDQPASRPRDLLAQIDLTPGWATFGLALPPGKALKAVRVGDLDTQTDIKTRWPDQSIRFVVVTAKVDKKDRYDLVAADRWDGPSPVHPPAQIRVNLSMSDGNSFSALLPSLPSEDLWLSGPLVQEWRSIVTPRDREQVSHPSIRLIFDYRVYRDAQARVDVTVENVLDTAAADEELYDVEILDSAGTLFQQSGITHHYLTRWRVVSSLGLSESAAKLDLEPFHQAGALPRFLPSIGQGSYSTKGPKFEILGKGGNQYSNMGATGGRNELACYPDSTARYIVHRTPSLRDYLIVNGDLAGAWPVHIRESDGSLVSIANRPDFWLDDRGDAKPKGRRSGPLKPDNAHQPSWAYVPYLITGDRFYADELAFWANYVMLRTWPYRRGGKGAGGFGEDGGFGLIGPGNQVRGFAWGLRNLVDAAAYLPDTYSEKQYFVERVKNNLDWADFYFGERGTLPNGAFAVKMKRGKLVLWQHNYLGWSIDHAHQQGFTGGESLLAALTGFQSKLFTSDPEFSREYGAPYVLRVGKENDEGELVLFTSMAELFKNNNGGPSKWNRDYAASARLMLMIQARHSNKRDP